MTTRPRENPIIVLLVEDNPGDAKLFEITLQEADAEQFELVHVDRLGAALEKLESGTIDIVLLDLDLPDAHGLETFERVHEHSPHLPTIMMTGRDDESTSVMAVRAGAQDYLIKGKVDGNLLVRSMLYAIERKAAEEALLKSEQELKELFDDAPVGYHELDTEGRITRINKTELDMLGYTADEMLGKEIWDFQVETDKKQARLDFKGKISGLTPPSGSFERIFKRKDGVSLPVLAENRLLKDDKGNIVGLRTTVQDITERKQAEEEREKLIAELQDAISKIKTLRGLVPICASCKKIRDDKGYWGQIEEYVRDHSDAEFSHGICPDCAKELYPWMKSKTAAPKEHEH